MYTESQKRANIKYLREKRENLNINLPLGAKERYKAHAQKRGKSLTGLIVDLLEQDIQNVSDDQSDNK